LLIFQRPDRSFGGSQIVVDECTIWYMDDQSGRDALLDAVIDYFAAEGLADQSLRQIAAAVNSSHRMLLYHFGSKDGLLVEVARGVEARAQAQLTEFAMSDGVETLGTDELGRRMWDYLLDPARTPFERLFFALYGRALQGDHGTLPLLQGNIQSWIENNVALSSARGIPTEISRTHARLGLAVTRGLLLDYLATGDRAGADAAMTAFLGRYAGSWWEDAAVTGEIPAAS
jgi:AcrR family transcriptional regulator